MNILQRLFLDYQFRPMCFHRLLEWTDDQGKVWKARLDFTFDKHPQSEKGCLILDDVSSVRNDVAPGDEEDPAEVIPDDVIENERKEIEKEILEALDERDTIRAEVRAAILEDESSAYESAIRKIAEVIGIELDDNGRIKEEDDEDDDDGD